MSSISFGISYRRYETEIHCPNIILTCKILCTAANLEIHKRKSEIIDEPARVTADSRFHNHFVRR